jgi:hypothetical protein
MILDPGDPEAQAETQEQVSKRGDRAGNIGRATASQVLTVSHIGRMVEALDTANKSMQDVYFLYLQMLTEYRMRLLTGLKQYFRWVWGGRVYLFTAASSG